MKKVLINFADGKFKRSQRLNSRTGRLIGGFDKVIEYSPADIDASFYNQHREILDEKRGAGLWLWKPYFIHKTLTALNDGDILMYCDSGAMFCRNVNSQIESMKNDIWVSDIPLIEEQWTKPALFEYFNVTENDRLSPQVQASFIILRKSNATVSFIEKWLDLCCVSNLIFPVGLHEERGECIEHREDQSILSVLCKKMGILPHPDPTQFRRKPEIYKGENRKWISTNHSDSTEKICIVHYRNTEIGKIQLLKLWILAMIPTRIWCTFFQQ